MEHLSRYRYGRGCQHHLTFLASSGILRHLLANAYTQHRKQGTHKLAAREEHPSHLRMDDGRHQHTPHTADTCRDTRFLHPSLHPRMACPQGTSGIRSLPRRQMAGILRRSMATLCTRCEIPQQGSHVPRGQQVKTAPRIRVRTAHGHTVLWRPDAETARWQQLAHPRYARRTAQLLQCLLPYSRRKRHHLGRAGQRGRQYAGKLEFCTQLLLSRLEVPSLPRPLFRGRIADVHPVRHMEGRTAGT